MYDHRPPVDLAQLLVDEDLLERGPALAAELDGQAPPCRRASMAARRIGSPAVARDAPAERARTRASSGWRTSMTKARARACSSSWAGVRVRSMAPSVAAPGDDALGRRRGPRDGDAELRRPGRRRIADRPAGQVSASGDRS